MYIGMCIAVVLVYILTRSKKVNLTTMQKVLISIIVGGVIGLFIDKMEIGSLSDLLDRFS